MRGSKGLASPAPLLGALRRGAPAPQIMEAVEVFLLVPAAGGQIVVCQCHRSCRYVEVEQLVRYFPQVQFLDKVDDCPLLCSLGFGPDSAACAVLDKVVDLPVIVQV